MRRVLFLFALCWLISEGVASAQLVDYKFWYIRRNDKGQITEAAIRYYTGAITTENEVQEDLTLKPVTRYRRSARLTEVDLGYLGSGFAKETSGADVKIYTPADFGVISTDDELRTFLNPELAKDPVRTPIDEQKEVAVVPLGP